MKLKGKKVAVLAEEIYQEMELWVPYYRLKEEGADVKIVAPEKKTYKGKLGYPVNADVAAADVSAKDFDGVVIPGGYAPDMMRGGTHVPRRTIARVRAFAPLTFLPFLGCSEPGGSAAWSGSVDTLPSGVVVVTNPATGIWDSTTTWPVVEEVRIGTLEETGPELLGDVTAVEMDAAGRLYVLEGQAQELRVFDRDGHHVRTIGRKGGGPGEFNQAIGMAWSPAGDLWVIDPQNNRISVIDTADTFVTSHPAIGGWSYSPWPGGFDTAGAFYTYVPEIGSADFGLLMVRYDTAMNPLDTLRPPRYPGEQEYFEFQSPQGGGWRTSVPFTPGFEWRLTTASDFWVALTGPYRGEEQPGSIEGRERLGNNEHAVLFMPGGGSLQGTFIVPQRLKCSAQDAIITAGFPPPSTSAKSRTIVILIGGLQHS